ncbi:MULTISPECIES: hypothetical protein [unclassified Anabaena]|uniref:hypothetical protein n=1 Tax=unclassified Anabaena TaxID=2619674 RepID=UPI001685493B|nr:hypothetical protein [Anabaena sp. UHCC 0399]MBD2362158.1 hypothetical protein [Anabaena minutissima FACHB-250]MEA5568619.1 hypothetical protein [Anabaena sp. UHCC 0399]
MPKRLVQAAIITFLLHVIAGLSPNTRLQSRTILPSTETPVQMISMLLRSRH